MHKEPTLQCRLQRKMRSKSIRAWVRAISVHIPIKDIQFKHYETLHISNIISYISVDDGVRCRGVETEASRLADSLADRRIWNNTAGWWNFVVENRLDFTADVVRRVGPARERIRAAAFERLLDSIKGLGQHLILTVIPIDDVLDIFLDQGIHFRLIVVDVFPNEAANFNSKNDPTEGKGLLKK